MNQALLRLFVATLWQRKLATALSLLAIALGVALGLAVQLIHAAALSEFGRGMRLVSGEADLLVTGPRTGFDDALFARIASQPGVAVASPVLELEAQLPGHPRPLRILGVDSMRVAAVSAALRPVADADQAGDERLGLVALREDALFLSAAARAQLDLANGDPLTVQTGLRTQTLIIRGAVPGAGSGQALAVMDIAAAQRVFDRIGLISRIDLRLQHGEHPAAVRERLQTLLPAGVTVLAPEVSTAQASGLSRAYRVNLTMLAAIALLTGGFLVFSTQLLAVVRRRQELALLRALGLEARDLMRGLLGEGLVLGLLGGALGVALAYLITQAAFSLLGGDLGAGFFAGVQPSLRFEPGLTLIYLLLGVCAGLAGAWLPAHEASRMMTARALKGGDEASLFQSRMRWGWALGIAALAALLTRLPAVAGIPVFGYAAVLLILLAAVLAIPAAVRLSMRLIRQDGALLLRLAHARLAAMPGQTVVAGAGVVASVALAVSMAIMVSSFRDSVDRWLLQVLPAEVYLRASSSLASGYLDPEAIAWVAAQAEVAKVEPVRFDSIRIDDERFPMTMLARPVRSSNGLPLVSGSVETVPEEGRLPVWISEAMADLLQLASGDPVELPIAGQAVAFQVAGVWRDYARQHGAFILELEDYRRLSGDRLSNDLAIDLHDGADREALMTRIRAHFGSDRIELASPTEIRRISLEIFDRTFLITYLMEAVAVLIGLFGIGTTFAALAASRRKEFGMLRHLGLLRTQIGRLLAIEGALTALIGFVVGASAGGAIAWVLIEVINRQSFHWSMDISIPFAMLAGFACALIALAALTARLAGAQAMRTDAVKAVREDW